jgi:hypothetical protein
MRIVKRLGENTELSTIDRDSTLVGSCSTRLLRYLLCRSSQASGIILSALSSLKAFG